MKDKQSAEFWRYLNGVKYFTAVGCIENFTTREPAIESLSKLFLSIGREIGFLVSAEKQFHFFSNPDIKQLHYLECVNESKYHEASKPLEFRHHLNPSNPLEWSFFSYKTYRDDAKLYPHIVWNPPDEIFPHAFINDLGMPSHLALAPFCKDDTPFGFYLFTWNGDEFPLLFQNSSEGERLREGAFSILCYLHNLVVRLISNHYPIHRDTYIPSFQRIGYKPVCILFADIRNFTSAFETSRLMTQTGDKYPQLLIGLIKAYLEAASITIAQPGIGRIDKFIGDGIMATFGEYILARDRHDVISCLLGLYASCILFDAFDKLRKRFFKHEVFKHFEREYNDILNIRLGIGLNFGNIHFDYFGSRSIQNADGSGLLGDYLEYTAVGDHVNVAQRLEGLSGKPITQVSLLERGTGREQMSHNFIAPITIGRTVFMRTLEALQPTGHDFLDLEEKYRSSFSLKGKGSAIEAYELFPEEINGDYIIRILEEYSGKRISNIVKKSWKPQERTSRSRGFMFDEDLADKLAARYFPSI